MKFGRRRLTAVAAITCGALIRRAQGLNRPAAGYVSSGQAVLEQSAIEKPRRMDAGRPARRIRGCEECRPEACRLLQARRSKPRNNFLELHDQVGRRSVADCVEGGAVIPQRARFFAAKMRPKRFAQPPMFLQERPRVVQFVGGDHQFHSRRGAPRRAPDAPVFARARGLGHGHRVAAGQSRFRPPDRQIAGECLRRRPVPP